MTAEDAALLRTASGLFRAGRAAEAAAAYERLLARAPGLPDSWFNLGVARRAIRDPAGALDAYAHALAHGVSGAEEVHLQRAVILSDDLGDADAARRELAAALAIAPECVPALLNLGNLCEDVGDRAGARTAYERALAAAPGNVLALSRLVGVTEVSGTDDPRLTQLALVAADGGRDPIDRADAGFARGAALDRLGAYETAFAAFAEANRVVAEASGAAFSVEGLARWVDESIAAFVTPEPHGGGGDDLVFICGMFRSGSTLVERILAAHPRVDAGGEITSLPALAAALGSPRAAAGAEGAAMRARYRAETAPRRLGGALLTDKRPDNLLHLGLAKRLFPDAKIVWTTRDPRDTAISIFALHAGPDIAYATDLASIAAVQLEQARLMAHWRSLYPDDIHEVRYERLAASPADEVVRLLGFLGLPPDATLHERFREGGAVRTASHWQVREPLTTRSVGRWRKYAALAGFGDDD